MKKYLLMAAMMVATLTTSAQNDDLKNEIGVYYGFGSASNIVGIVGHGIFGSGQKGGFVGPIGLEYFHHLSPVVALGAQVSYATCSYENTWGGPNDRMSFFTAMPSIKFNWHRRAHFGMYSGLSAGVLIMSESVEAANKAHYDEDASSSASFMFNVTALGTEFGGEAFRGFAELGFGEKGVLCVGLRYKF